MSNKQKHKRTKIAAELEIAEGQHLQKIFRTHNP